LLSGFYQYHKIVCSKANCPTKKETIKASIFLKELKDKGYGDDYIK